MLAMHYRIPLAGIRALEAIRHRAAERGPLFDGMDGLGHKFFLADADDPAYATFYLWRDADAAHRFLRGPFFAALVDAFGRPPVRLLLTSAIDLPVADPRTVTLIEGVSPHAFGPRIDALDPRDGAPLSLRFDEAVRGRRFELLYHARSGVPVARPVVARPAHAWPVPALGEL